MALHTVPPAPDSAGPYRHQIPVHVEPGSPDAFVYNNGPGQGSADEHPVVHLDDERSRREQVRLDALRAARHQGVPSQGVPSGSGNGSTGQAGQARRPIGRPHQGQPGRPLVPGQFPGQPHGPTSAGSIQPGRAQRRLPGDAQGPLFRDSHFAQRRLPPGADVPGRLDQGQQAFGFEEEGEAQPLATQSDLIRLSFYLNEDDVVEAAYQAVVREENVLILVRNPQSSSTSFMPRKPGRSLAVRFPDGVVLRVTATGFAYPVYGLEHCILLIHEDHLDLGDLGEALAEPGHRPAAQGVASQATFLTGIQGGSPLPEPEPEPEPAPEPGRVPTLGKMSLAELDQFLASSASGDTQWPPRQPPLPGAMALLNPDDVG